MRLKFLFFPAVLVISVAVIIGFVWPEFESMKTKKSEYVKNQETLNNMLERRNNVKTLSKDLEINKERKDLIMGYLPLAKSEERIVDSLNYLSTSVGVSIVNISVNNKEAAAGASQQVEGGAAASEVRIAGAVVSVMGEYDKILMYLDQIQRSNLYNVITSVNISKQESVQAKTGDESAVAPNADLLKAEIAVDFGYMPITQKANYSASVLEKSKFNFAFADDLKTLISQKVPDIQSEKSGKNNPFLP